MAIKTKSEIMELIKGRIGEDNSDEALALIEDVQDTLDDLEEKGADTTNWKEKYEQNDASWREKYKARFFAGSSKEEDENLDPEPSEKPKTFDDLFKEG